MIKNNNIFPRKAQHLVCKISASPFDVNIKASKECIVEKLNFNYLILSCIFFIIFHQLSSYLVNEMNYRDEIKFCLRIYNIIFIDDLFDEELLCKIYQLLKHDITFESDHPVCLRYIGIYYRCFNINDDLCIKYFLMASNKNDNYSLCSLGDYYCEKKQYDLMIKYYSIAVDNLFHYAMFSLAYYYFNIEKNYDLAKKYYSMAIEYGNSCAINNLAYYYEIIENNYVLTEKYYLMAIEKGVSQAMNNLANFYRKVITYHNATALSVFLKDRNIFDVQKLCVKYYLMAIENDNVDALNHLANYYQSVGEYKNAEKYFLMAVEKNDVNAMNNLGYFYHNIKLDCHLAKKYYLMAIEHDNCSAMSNLGYYYQFREKNYNLMKKYYLMASKLKCDLSFHVLLNLYKDIKNIQMDKYFIEFCNIANSNIFNVSVPMIFKIIDELYTNKLNSMDLHFNYTPIGNNNNGFNEAKNDFIKKIESISL